MSRKIARVLLRDTSRKRVEKCARTSDYARTNSSDLDTRRDEENVSCTAEKNVETRKLACKRRHLAMFKRARDVVED